MEVLAVSDTGRARTVTIGRLKIERRPLLLIEAEAEGERLNVFIQDDWHVRVMGSKGEIRPSREIQVGEALLDAVEANPELVVTVDVANLTLEAPDAGISCSFPLDESTRERFLEGLDDIGISLHHEDDIAHYEGTRPAWLPTTA